MGLLNTRQWFASGQSGDSPFGDNIGNSVRFRNNAELRRSSTPAVGETWTVSFWTKLGEPLGTNQSDFYWFNFGPTDNVANLYMDNYTSNPTQNNRIKNAGGSFFLDGLWRDYNAWYHIVWQNVPDSDATGPRIYVNGVEECNMQGVAFNIGAGQFVIGANNDAYSSTKSSNFEGYQADWYFIDGQALEPTAFGRFNEDGVWVPRDAVDFTPATPRYSDFLTAPNGFDTGNGRGAENAFNGLLPASSSEESGYIASTNTGNMTFAPTEGIAFTSTVEVWGWSDQGNNVSFNGGAAQAINSYQWETIASGGGTLNTIELSPRGSNSSTHLAGIRINGDEILLNPFQWSAGLTWSSAAGGYQSNTANRTATGLISPNQAFDGNLAGQCQSPGSAAWLYWNPQEAIPCTTVQLIVNNDLDQTPGDAYINGTQVSPLPTPVLNGSNYYVSFDVPGGSLTEFAFANRGGPNTSIFGMSVNNGNILINGANNSYGSEGFHLDFADPFDIGKDVSGNNNNFTPTGLNLNPVGIFSNDIQGSGGTYETDPANRTATILNRTLTFDGAADGGSQVDSTPVGWWYFPREFSGVNSLAVDLWFSNATGSLRINGAEVTYTRTVLTNANLQRLTVTNPPANVTEIACIATQPNTQPTQILINGQVLTDNTGTDYDLMQDSPTQNYATGNLLYSETGATPGVINYSKANLAFTSSNNGFYNGWASQVIPAGDTNTYYFEFSSTAASGGYPGVTIMQPGTSPWNAQGLSWTTQDGVVFYNTVQQTAWSGATYSANDVAGFSYNASTGVVIGYINGTQAGTFTMATGIDRVFGCQAPPQDIPIMDMNFGQRPFLHQPAGTVPLQTQNLPAVTIKNGTDHFRALTAPGASILDVAQGNVNGYFDASGFTSGMWWIKDMDNSQQHQIGSTLTGRDTIIFCPSAPNAMDDSPYIAPSGESVAWCWSARDSFTPTGTNGLTNLSGLRNQDAGFSIVTASAAGSANASYTHGLTETPQFIMAKCRTNAFNWICYHEGLTGAPNTTRFLNLNDAAGEQNNNALMFDVTNAGTVVLGQNVGINDAGDDYVYYNWHSVPGYSSIGTYVGNNNADGTFVYTGFKPAFVMMKELTASASWYIFDSTRNVTNPFETDDALEADLNNDEATNPPSGTSTVDFLSNGFKQRQASGGTNSANTYAYIAFASNPFGGSNVPPNTAALTGPPQISGITTGLAKSLRFKNNDQTLTRTQPAGETLNGTDWCASFWLKSANPDSGEGPIFVLGTSAPQNWFLSTTSALFSMRNSPGGYERWDADVRRRDPNAWYHVYFEGTTANVISLWVNGVQQPNTITMSSMDAPINFGHETNDGNGQGFDGYLADIYLVGGSRLGVSTFAEYNNDGVWVPIEDPTIDDYGVNGFKLVMDPAYQSGNILLDQSGNENNFTLVNVDTDDYFDANFDWMKDGPGQNYATLNPLVEEGWNPNSNNNAPAEYTGAALFMGNSSGSFPSLSQAGQYIENIYFEIGPTLDADNRNYPGIIGYNLDYSPTDTTSDMFNVLNTGQLRIPGQATTTVFDPWFQNDTVRVRYTASTRVLEMATNDGNWVSSNLSAFVPAGTRIGFGLQAFGADGRGTINYGQQPFNYEVPTGFEAAVTSNYPAAAIPNGRDHFRTLIGPAAGGYQLYGSQSRDETLGVASFTEVGPCPGSTVQAEQFILDCFGDVTTTSFTISNGWGWLGGNARISVSTDGSANSWTVTNANQTMGNDETVTITNASAFRYVKLYYLVNGGGVNFGDITTTNNPILTRAQSAFPSGLWAVKSITNSSTMQFVDSVTNAATGQTSASLCPRANNTEGSGFTTYVAPTGNALAFCWNYNAADPSVNGFAITRYTGNGTGTQAHNLGAEPDMIWVGCRSGVTDTSVGMNVFFRNNLQNSANTYSSLARTSNPSVPSGASTGAIASATSTTITYTGSTAAREGVNTSGEDYTMYLWNEVPGFSKFGTYGGNTSPLLPFIYCGFRPALVIIMRANGGGGHWTVYNTTQNVNNPAGEFFFIDDTAGSDAFSGSTKEIDILSNGFKIRTQDSDITAQNDSYIYMAWAENPFGGSNVSPVTAR